MKEAYRDFVISDIHFPFHDENAVSLVMQIVRFQRPKRVILNGDILDFYTLSKYDKDPSRKDKYNLQYELSFWYDFVRTLRGASPESEIHFVCGNHEDRLRKYIWKYAPVIADFVTLEELLKCKEFGVHYYEDKARIDGVLYTHGTVIRKWGSYTARGMFEKYGCSGVSGHSHRLGYFNVRQESGPQFWRESGCLCDLMPEYVRDPDWHHGFVVVDHFPESKWVKAMPVEINERYEADLDGKLYKLPNTRRDEKGRFV